ncbi:hypothetical protein BDZ97DRAFT_1958772 [Flammula alnicola]|nr:hypothetical protein BDZ97DRAFT_1958772 [Flammula alnicola]
MHRTSARKQPNQTNMENKHGKKSARGEFERAPADIIRTAHHYHYTIVPLKGEPRELSFLVDMEGREAGEAVKRSFGELQAFGLIRHRWVDGDFFWHHEVEEVDCGSDDDSGVIWVQAVAGIHVVDERNSKAEALGDGLIGWDSQAQAGPLASLYLQTLLDHADTVLVEPRCRLVLAVSYLPAKVGYGFKGGRTHPLQAGMGQW